MQGRRSMGHSLQFQAHAPAMKTEARALQRLLSSLFTLEYCNGAIIGPDSSKSCGTPRPSVSLFFS